MSSAKPTRPRKPTRARPLSRRQQIARDFADLAADPVAALKGAPVLERWKVFGRSPRRTVVGFVFGHPLIDDGRFVETSPVIRIDPDGGWVRTWSRLYRLGIPFDDIRGVQ